MVDICRDGETSHINKEILLSIRHIAVTDPAKACFQYGLSMQEAEDLKNLTLEQIDTVSKMGIGLFRLRLPVSSILHAASSELDSVRLPMKMVMQLKTS